MLSEIPRLHVIRDRLPFFFQCLSCLQLGLGLGLKEVLVFDSKSENRDRAVEAVEAVPEARAV